MYVHRANTDVHVHRLPFTCTSMSYYQFEIYKIAYDAIRRVSHTTWSVSSVAGFCLVWCVKNRHQLKNPKNAREIKLFLSRHGRLVIKNYSPVHVSLIVGPKVLESTYMASY